MAEARAVNHTTHEVQGSIVIREHCTFIWRQTESAYQRVVDIEPNHCATCVAYLAKQSGFILNDLRRRPRSGTG
jgi:hypothetical protein